MKTKPIPILTPLDQVESDIVHIRLPLPVGVDSARIGIDMVRLETLCRVAGIRQLSIAREDGIDSTKTSITGINQDGSATGIGESQKTKSASEHGMNPGISKPFISTNVRITIDTDELGKTVTENYPQGARSIPGWSQELQKLILTHLRKEGTSFLLSGNKDDFSREAKVLSYFALFGIILHHNIIPSIIVNMLTFKTAMYASSLFAKKARPDIYVRNPILSVGGCEWDRALLFLGMILNTRNLIREIREEE